MAWRIDEHVVRGEISNEEKGKVTGLLWFHGLEEPVRLELEGNAAPDLAGCRLTFENLGETFAPRSDITLGPVIRGAAGELTAARKVREFELPLEVSLAMKRRGEEAPEFKANCLYLEWFGPAGGRVVLESVRYRLTVSPPVWRMTEAEDQARRHQAAGALDRFLKQFDEAADRHGRGLDPEEDWDEHQYERFLRQGDARTDKFGELMDLYQNDPDRDRKIDEAMGWNREPAYDIPWEDIEADMEDDKEPEPDPATEGKDWIRTDDGDIRHPVQHRAHGRAHAFWLALKEMGLERSEDDELQKLVFETRMVGVKLAGALNHLWSDTHMDPAFTVAWTKRGLGFLHKAQATLETVAGKGLLPDDLVARTRADLLATREEILAVMDDLRGRKGR